MTADATSGLAAAQRKRALAGKNTKGELGDGTTTRRDVPTPVSTSTVSSWLAISPGYTHTCGLATDRQAYCWGESPPRLEPSTMPDVSSHMYLRRLPRQDRVLAGANANGELGDGTTTDQLLPTPVSTSPVSSWFTISAGREFTAALAL